MLKASVKVNGKTFQNDKASRLSHMGLAWRSLTGTPHRYHLEMFNETSSQAPIEMM